MSLTSIEQLHANASVGLATRRARAQLRNDMVAGRICVRQVILNPPPCVHGMRVFEVLELAPGIGRERTARLNVRAARVEPIPVNLMREVGRIGERTRRWVIDALDQGLGL